MKQQLHPGVKWSFRLGAYWSFIFFAIFLSVISLTLFISLGIPVVFSLLVYIVIFIIIGEVYARMSYANWFYEFTNTEVKLERGIIWKKYSNIPYQRIQNIDITRGIIARLCGFSTVNLQTAGYSMAGGRGFMSEGYIPAVEIAEAERIRSFVMKKISKIKNQGL